MKNHLKKLMLAKNHNRSSIKKKENCWKDGFNCSASLKINTYNLVELLQDWLRNWKDGSILLTMSSGLKNKNKLIKYWMKANSMILRRTNHRLKNKTLTANSQQKFMTPKVIKIIFLRKRNYQKLAINTKRNKMVLTPWTLMLIKKLFKLKKSQWQSWANHLSSSCSIRWQW